VYFVDEKHPNESHQLLVVFPFPSHAVPLLRCGYDYVSTLYIAEISDIAVAGQLGTLEAEFGELGFPIPLTFGAQSLRRCLVNHLVLTRCIIGNSTTHGQLENDGFAACCRRCKHKVIVGIVYSLETLGLNGVKGRIREHGPETIR
jgi:hypothetical protein